MQNTTETNWSRANQPCNHNRAPQQAAISVHVDSHYATVQRRAETGVRLTITPRQKTSHDAAHLIRRKNDHVDNSMDIVTDFESALRLNHYDVSAKPSAYIALVLIGTT